MILFGLLSRKLIELNICTYVHTLFLNPIEYAFNTVKSEASKVQIDNVQDLEAVVDDIFDNLPPESCDNTYNHVTKYFAPAKYGIPFSGRS
jgi:hypothetical protein